LSAGSDSGIFGRMSDVTRLLEAAGQGDGQAAADLLPLVYGELRKLAAVRLAAEAPGQTLPPTALVHEAYLRLVGQDPAQPWKGRGHFFGAAAEAMRRILVDAARRKQAGKRGGDRRREPLSRVDASVPESDDDLLALDEALTRLEAADPAKAAVVKLRYFTGLTMEQVAEVQGVSLATANRAWAFARAWLYQQVTGEKKA
jgi:RNA polymerase sigma factor (TIGR02999 family)